MEDKGVVYTGYPSAEELAGCPGVPSGESMKKGPMAVIECVQCIPCNPCEDACVFGAIIVGDSITNLPRLDAEKCRGCGTCVAACPGQAIFLVDMTHGEDTAMVEFPFEYLPLPKKGDTVDAVNRAGEVVCKALVDAVLTNKSFTGTNLIKLIVPKKFANEVRSMKRLPR